MDQPSRLTPQNNASTPAPERASAARLAREQARAQARANELRARENQGAMIESQPPEPPSYPYLPAEEPAPRPRRRWFRPETLGPAFWTVTAILSLITNAILIAVVLGLAQNLFTLKQTVSDQLISGLYQNFSLMDQAHIRTTIPVNAQVPAKFDLELNQSTVVKLDRNTPIRGARVSLATGGLSILSAPTDIILPAGTELPIHLNLTVPVDKTIPVNLMVNVDIPLQQTELHEPFTGLQNVVRPYQALLGELPNTWAETLCGPETNTLCTNLLR